VLAVPGIAWARAPSLKLQLEAGPEYDTNLGRVDPGTEPIVAGPLMRLTTAAQLGWRATSRSALDLAFKGGTRQALEPSQRENDVSAMQTQAQWAYRTRARAVLSAAADYYDSFEQHHPAPGPTTSDPLISRNRDFRTESAHAQVLIAGTGNHRLAARAGYRFFTYKPDRDFDFRGDEYGLDYSTRWEDETAEGDVEAEYDLHLGYTLARRHFAGNVYANACPPGDMTCLPEQRPLARSDLYHAFSVGGSYTGPIKVSLDYTLSYNDSNSYGQSLLRHVGTLTITKDLPWQVFLTLRAQLQVFNYLDPLVVKQNLAGQLTSIEDESRNSLLVDLERALDTKDRLHAVLRYTLQSTPEFPLWRQLVFAGLSYAVE
jgi:hypothetical protein